MAHMVIFQGTDGAPGYQQCEGLDDAMKFVEELRNERGVERARIFRMEEVEFEFKPYYFVVRRGEEAPAGERPAGGFTAAGSAEAEVAEPTGEAGAEGDEVTAEASEQGADTGSDEESSHDEEATEEESSLAPPPPSGRGLFGR